MEKEQLEAIWKTILQKDDEIQMDDDFFELGGNSFSALLILNEINEAGYDLSIDEVCDCRTFYDMLRVVNEVGKHSENHSAGKTDG